MVIRKRRNKIPSKRIYTVILTSVHIKMERHSDTNLKELSVMREGKISLTDIKFKIQDFYITMK